MRTFYRICVKFMAVILFVCVLFSVRWAVAEALALNPLGVLPWILLGLVLGVTGYVFWTRTDDIVLDYAEQDARRIGMFLKISNALREGVSPPSAERPSGSPGSESLRATAQSPSPSLSTVDLHALHEHLGAADSRLVQILAEAAGQPLQGWIGIREWAVDEAAWVDGLPDADCLVTFRREYRDATDTAQGFADQVLVALRANDPVELETLSATAGEIDARFRGAFETAPLFAGASPGRESRGVVDDQPDDVVRTFAGVWFMEQRPRSSLTAFRDRRSGTLSIRQGVIRFRDRRGEVHIGGIEWAGRYMPREWDPRSGQGDDIVNDWIEVGYVTTSGDHLAVYIADGGWFGLHAIARRWLGRKTQQDLILEVLRNAIGTSGPSPSIPGSPSE